MHQAGLELRGIARSERHNTEGLLFIIGREESQLVLDAVTHGNLVIAAPSVKADEKEFAS